MNCEYCGCYDKMLMMFVFCEIRIKVSAKLNDLISMFVSDGKIGSFYSFDLWISFSKMYKTSFCSFE